jgi:hypothetical protein
MANAPTFADLLAKATTLGEEAGKGVDTQIKFMLSTVEGGYHNAIDLAPNKHGTGIDDATKLSEAYFKARSGAVVFDAKAPNQRKLISTVRTSIKLGAWPKGGNGEPLATVNNLMTLRQNLKKNPAKAKKLDDATNTLLKYARVQLKRDQLVPDTELEEFCLKKEADVATVEDILARTVKQLDKLIDGSAAHGTAQCNTANTTAARQFLRKELAAIATARNPQPIKKPVGNGVQPSP